MAGLSKKLQVVEIQLNNPFSVEDQRKFWKKIHKLLLQDGRWWISDRRMVWVDFVYKHGEMVKVFFSFPSYHSEKIKGMFTVKGRRKSVLGSASCRMAERNELVIPKTMSTCELHLAYEKLFSLSTARSILLPCTLPLEESETARISFCLQPTSTSWLNEGKQVIKEKVEKGVVHPKKAVKVNRFIPLFLLFFQRFLNVCFHGKKETEYVPTWLSPETIKKWNDSHYKILIRLAGPQRLLPKLARPFQTLKGENRLDLYFCPRSENGGVLRELNRQKLQLSSKQGQRKNVVSTRELITMVPFLSFSPGTMNQIEARPQFG